MQNLGVLLHIFQMLCTQHKRRFTNGFLSLIHYSSTVLIFPMLLSRKGDSPILRLTHYFIMCTHFPNDEWWVGCLLGGTGWGGGGLLVCLIKVCITVSTLMSNDLTGERKGRTGACNPDWSALIPILPYATHLHTVPYRTIPYRTIPLISTICQVLVLWSAVSGSQYGSLGKCTCCLLVSL